jgi:FAD:protein FMN transferase
VKRRIFVAGSLAAATLVACHGVRLRRDDGEPAAQPLADGRYLVRDAALAFGTQVCATAIHRDPGIARAGIAEALARTRRIHDVMSLFDPASQVSRLNAAGVLHDPDEHLVRVLEFARRMAESSDGAFDMTVQPLWQLFAACSERGRLPDAREIAEARELVDASAVQVSARRISLARPGMAVTLNGIAQGYAADLALAALRELGVHDAIVDTGEFGAEGERAPRQAWTLGVRHPRNADALAATVAMDGRFVATSGDYATAFSADFLHHHIFDPRTGDSPTRWSCVVVAARTGIEADALTKPMMVLEPARARDVLARFAGAGAAWFDKSGELSDCVGMPLARG